MVADSPWGHYIEVTEEQSRSKSALHNPGIPIHATLISNQPKEQEASGDSQGLTKGQLTLGLKRQQRLTAPYKSKGYSCFIASEMVE